MVSHKRAVPPQAAAHTAVGAPPGREVEAAERAGRFAAWLAHSGATVLLAFDEIVADRAGPSLFDSLVGACEGPGTVTGMRVAAHPADATPIAPDSGGRPCGSEGIGSSRSYMAPSRVRTSVMSFSHGLGVAIIGFGPTAVVAQNEQQPVGVRGEGECAPDHDPILGSFGGEGGVFRTRGCGVGALPQIHVEEKPRSLSAAVPVGVFAHGQVQPAGDRRGLPQTGEGAVCFHECVLDDVFDGRGIFDQAGGPSQHQRTSRGQERANQSPDAADADPVSCGQFSLRRTVVEGGDDRFTLFGGQPPVQQSRRHRWYVHNREFARASWPPWACGRLVRFNRVFEAGENGVYLGVWFRISVQYLHDSKART